MQHSSFLQYIDKIWLQELRKAIKVLREDSKKKLSHDAEVHGAVDQLWSKVEQLREGLSTISDAMMQEVAGRNRRIEQVLFVCTAECCLPMCSG